MSANRLCRLSATGIVLAMSLSAAQAGLLPERVAKAGEDRIAAGMYQTLVLAVVDGDKSEIAVFGKLDGGKAPDGDTVYEIGSITKTFTATMLAQEVLAGKVGLDTPVAQLLPGWSIPSRGGKQITLGDIGTQRSGLPRLPTNLQPTDSANPYADYDAARLKAFLAGYTLPRDPGAAYEYSNLAFGLLGYALAQSNHTDYGTLLGQRILKPLGMSASGTAFTGAMRAHLAPGHDEAGKPAKNWDIDALAGAGAIRSTANDMLRYLKANMNAGAGAAMKFAQQPRAEVGKEMRIGLAWMTTSSGIVWHNGGTGGYHSFLGFTADGKHGVVVLTNTAVQVDDLGFAALDPAAALAAANKSVALPAAALDAYVGSYKLADKFLIKIFRMGDDLYAQGSGQAPFPIYASGPDEFFAKMADIAISFKRDATGAVTALVLHQNGDHLAPRLSAAELPPEPKEATLDAAAMRDYVGKFRFEFGAVLTVTLSGNQLAAQLTGQPSIPVYPSAKDEFFYKVVEARLSFERDGSGKVTAVVLHQNGRDMRAPRTE